MGNCWSRFRSSESTNPHPNPVPSLSPMDPSSSTSGDPVPPPPTDPPLPTSRDPVPDPPVPTSGNLVPPPPMDPPLSISGDPVPPPPSMDAIESIREMYDKISPVELIDPLVTFIEDQLHKMKNPSEAGPSSSEGRLGTVRDVTKLAATTLDTISTEAEKLSKSYALKEMGSVMIKVMKGVGELHWAFIGLSMAAFAVESYMSVGSTQNECKELLLNIVDLAKDVKQYGEQMPDRREKVRKAVGTIVEGTVLCLGYLNRGKFSRFWLSKTAGEEIEKINQQLRDARNSLILSVDLQIQKQLTKRLDRSPLHLLDIRPVGIEDQVQKVKDLLDRDGTLSALAVIVCGFGGMGKSTLAAAALQSLDWNSTDFKFCKVEIDEKTFDRRSHIIKLQRDIIYDIGGVKLDLRDPQEGRLQIKNALQKNKSVLFIDNVVDKEYVQDLLPKEFSSGEQKTKLRILITSRDKSVKAELKMICKEYDVNSLSREASQRLLLETILEEEVVEDRDFDEQKMINKVANACRGVPLLLSVFGKHLRSERNQDSYREVLDVLQGGNLDSYRDEYLRTKLMFVYNKIKDVEVKEAFLDICTYFHCWEWSLVADIVDSSKLEDLRRRMLVSSSSGKVIIHDILRFMAMEEAKVTRFSNFKELSDAMEDNSHGLEVKGISLINDDSLITIQSIKLEAMHKSLRVLMLGDWATLEEPPCKKAFANLRYLRVGDITAFPFKDPSRLEKLRVLVNSSKPGMNLSHLPSSIKHISHEVPYAECDQFVKLPFENLRCLKSFIVKTQKSVKLPEELHLPASLVDLNLSTCKNLPKDIGHLTALESVILDRSDLECLPQGFGQLKKLRHLSMDYCSKLTFLPEELGMLSSLEVLSMKGCGSLRTLPERFGGLLSLQTLEFSECINLQELPGSIGQLRIQSLNLHSLVSLNEIPESMANMTFLKDLSLESCHSLTSLPKSFAQLKMLESLKIIDCTKLRVLPEDFGQLRCLNHMTVERCDLLEELPHGFGALPALKTFTLSDCHSFVTLSRDFGELNSLEELSLDFLPLISRFPDGFGNLKKLRLLNVNSCGQLKTFSDDFENMATLERLSIRYCSELDGAMMEKIVKLPNCYMADIDGSEKLLEKWKHMQGETEHPIVIVTGMVVEEKEEKKRAIRVSLLHGKCMEVKNENGQLMERSSLLVGLEEGTTTTVAVILLPIHMQSHQHQILQRFVKMAGESAESNGSGKLQVVCARKVDLNAGRPTATDEEERAEEEDIRQILVRLPLGSCAIHSSEYKRVKVFTWCCDRYLVHHDRLSFFMANVGVDIEGRKSFENLEFSNEYDISVNVPSPSKMRQPPQTRKPENSIQKFIKSICGREGESQSTVGENKTREFIEALKENRIEYLLTHNNTNKMVVDDLHGKAIGFIICDFKFLGCIDLQQIYKDLQEKDSNFIVIWVPIVWADDCGHGSYTRLIQCMPWATFHHSQMVNVKDGSLLERIRHPCFVVLNKDGQLANSDALPLLLAWGAKSYPFTPLTIPESFSLVESESCLEFLLHGMNIVGRKPMRSKMTFLFAKHPSEWLTMKSKLEELTQIHGSFEVLYVGRIYDFENLKMYDFKFDEWNYYDIEKLKQEYEDATQNMSWASLSFSDMIMFWFRCNYLASEEGYRLNKDTNPLMETLHGLAKQLKSYVLLLVDNGGVVTGGGEDVVQMIHEPLDGEGMGMGMRKVKDELISSLSSGECSPVVRTYFRDEIRNHPQHPIGSWVRLYSIVTCGVCGVQTGYDDWSVQRSNGCREWHMCGNCWMAYANQQAEQLVRAEDN